MIGDDVFAGDGNLGVPGLAPGQRRGGDRFAHHRALGGLAGGKTGGQRGVGGKGGDGRSRPKAKAGPGSTVTVMVPMRLGAFKGAIFAASCPSMRIEMVAE